jgi:chromosomal replication initiator protein
MNLVEEKWIEILNRVKEEHEILDVSFDTWLAPLKVHEVEGNVVTILVPSQQVGLDYVSKKYKLPLKVAIAEITGTSYEIKLLLPEDIERQQAKQEVFNTAAEAGLNPKYTFDTFVVGSNNKFAHAASLAVAESPGEIYNPLFLYGGVGLGKTHLMHSIAHFILKNNPSSRILYATSEEFTNELIEAIRNGNNTAMSKFREKYRNIDVLLIDDIQFIAGKERIQEEFFHTFNSLHESGKQIILSSDKPPKDIPLLEDRLKSRFEWGLIADISNPDYETRLAILRKKAQTDNILVDDEILSNIATKVASNIRELEGVFNKLVAFSSLAHGPITMEMAEKAINDISSQKEKVISAEYIQEVVAKYFNINKRDLKSSKRSNDIAYPRQIAMYLCREVAQMSFPKIGEEFGKRDHTTVMHGYSKIEKELKDNSNTKLIVESVKNIILKDK